MAGYEHPDAGHLNQKKDMKPPRLAESIKPFTTFTNSTASNSSLLIFHKNRLTMSTAKNEAEALVPKFKFERLLNQGMS